MYGVIGMIEFEIDGQTLSAPEGSMIIEAADAAGIYIPRFCYHRKLSVVANCRMCLVEVANARKPVPACATPVTQDMKVLTTSPAALASQREVMKFLLINHPLDCPICDQGGECELQDLSMGFGASHSDFNEAKRSVASEDIGPLIETWMTRCIHCTRCVRFGEEIAGMRELGITFRGEASEIGTYVKHFMKSELSGNIIDICPVGALTAKPSRYSERAWELKEHPSIAPHDCVGSHIYLNTRGQEYAPQRFVMRVNSRDADTVNECWISDRDRFSYEGLYHTDRVLKPRMKKNGVWEEVEWKYALMAVADRLQAICQHQGPEQIAALVSPNSTVEESYLMQKLMRALGSPHVDHRLRTLDFSDQAHHAAVHPLGCQIVALEEMDAVLLIGSMIRHEQPLLAHRINKAVTHGATAMAINPADYTLTFPVDHQLIHYDLVHQLAEVVKAAADIKQVSLDVLATVEPSEVAKAIAKTLVEADKGHVLLGNLADEHPQASQLRALAQQLATLAEITVGYLSAGANSTGATMAGAVPFQGVAGISVDKEGRDAHALLSTDPVRAYLLLNIEPEFDTAYPAEALTALKDAGCVVAMTAFLTPVMEGYADFILPVAPFSETPGSFMNIEGIWQHFSAASEPHGEAKPAWKVLSVLAHFLQLEHFEYRTAHMVRREIEVHVEAAQSSQVPQPSAISLTKPDLAPMVVATPHMYRVDGLVRRAVSLQACIDDVSDAVRMNSATANALGLAGASIVSVTQADETCDLACMIDESLADQVVFIPAALADAHYIGANFTATVFQPRQPTA